MKNVIAAAALSLVLSDFAYANEQRDEAMMKITPSTLVDADIHAVSPALARFGREAISNDLWQRDALSVALESDLIAMIPALYLLNQQVTDQVHVFELPFKSRRITVSQMWHPRMERDPGHRWLREQILAICGVGRSVMTKEPV
jgi:DNA-binding transcriptional LysR family regulator